MNILGSMSAADALNAAKAGEQRAKDTVAFAENDVTGDGFPGFNAIWDKVWGVAQGILNPAPNIASSSQRTGGFSEKQGTVLTGAAVAGVGILALAVVLNQRKTPRRRYARMRRSR